MGRTLHWEIKPKNGCFTKKELEKLYNVGRIYNERCNWTCESFMLEPYGFYPNWEYLRGCNCDDGWKCVNKRYKELAQKELHPNEIAKKLVKEKIAVYFKGNPEYGFSGFCKTGGNELNSLQVVMGCLAATRVIKNAIVHLHDEGELLIGEYLILDSGKARLDDDKIQQQIGYLLSKALFCSVYASHKERFVEKAKELYDMIQPPQSGPYNSDELHDISKFVRPINPKDFEEYPEYGAAQIMAGFEGEYWKLNNQDPEAASYRMIAQIQKILPKDVVFAIAPKF